MQNTKKPKGLAKIWREIKRPFRQILESIKFATDTPFFWCKIGFNVKSNAQQLPQLPRLEIHIVDHCNLNCRGCTHFCNIAPENFLNIEDFIRDLTESVKKINFGEIKLMGGEPLLHPDLHLFLCEARRICPDKEIVLITNCILLDKMTDTFWNAVRDNNISITLSKYPPLDAKFSHYADMFASKGVKIARIVTADQFWLLRNPNGNSKPHETYQKCLNAYCRHLRKGRLYICPDACYMDYYNNYFNKNIPVDEGIDIYKHSSREIYKYLTTSKETCKYCTTKRTYVPWSRSEKREDEWNAVD